MIVDGAKEMRLGEFARSARRRLASCRARSPILHGLTPPSIRELKKGAARKLTRSGAPRRLWCFALEYEAYVRRTLHMTSIA
eukprot:CCRYP_005937-RB/>CCRYP_005937-RB protein AED:0.46 eAED:0.46 QI:0/0/0/1/0/0.5/2/0/81